MRRRAGRARAEVAEQAEAAAAQARLQRAGGVVDPGVDHAAVVGGLVLGQGHLLLQHHHLRLGLGDHELAGGGQTEDPAPDDDVAHAAAISGVRQLGSLALDRVEQRS